MRARCVFNGLRYSARGIRRWVTTVSPSLFQCADYPYEMNDFDENYHMIETYDEVSSFIEEADRLRYSVVLGEQAVEKKIHMKAIVSEITKKIESGRFNRLGALIISNSIEHSVNIYRELKILDGERKLNISRLGSFSHKAPLLDVEEISVNESLRNELIDHNLIRVVEHSGQDIIIATPSQLLLFPPSSYIFDSEYVVIDDFELQFQNNSTKRIDRILESISEDSRLVWVSRNPTPSMPQYLKDWFGELGEIESGSLTTTITPTIKSQNQLKVFTVEPNHKGARMMEIIRKNKDQRGVIICKSAEEAKSVQLFLSRNQTRSFLLSSSNQAAPRVWSILCFKTTQNAVLVCDEKSIRSVELKEADFAICTEDFSSETNEYYIRRAVNQEETPIYILREVPAH